MKGMIDTTAGEPARNACPETAAAAPATRPYRADPARFSKRFAEEWLFRATLFNSLRASAAARRSRWLRVPHVLDADPSELRIDYEHLSADWVQVRSVIRDRSFNGAPAPELRRMFWTIGAALDELHRRTHRIHGDFDFDNILVKHGADQAVFVDFTPPVYTSFRSYNRADPYRDIATFLLGICAKYPPYLIHLALRPRVRALGRAFVTGYFHDRPADFDRRRLEGAINDLLDGTYLGASFAGRFLRRTRLFRTDDLAPEG